MICTIGALLWTFMLPFMLQTLSNNEHVTVTLTSPASISVSKAGVFAVLFTPHEGIHVNSVPVFELQLEKYSAFEVVGRPAFRKDDKGYLEFSEPVEFSLKAKKGTQPGKYSLKGKLNYFYCSDSAGWCNRFTQPVEASIEITK